MLATFSLTQTIAIFMGIYMLAAGVGLVTDSANFAKIMEDFKTSIGLTYLAAIAAFIMGAVIVASHNVWNTPLEIIVSLIGWAALAEGVLMLAFRRPFFTVIGAMPLNEGFMKGYGIFVLVLGAVMLYLALA